MRRTDCSRYAGVRLTGAEALGRDWTKGCSGHSAGRTSGSMRIKRREKESERAPSDQGNNAAEPLGVSRGAAECWDTPRDWRCHHTVTLHSHPGSTPPPRRTANPATAAERPSRAAAVCTERERDLSDQRPRLSTTQRLLELPSPRARP
ncbi:hypothetical protein COCON_G00219700 [Conger conger]|uniref:Uncharacterized protein n=1 Tax=Conger conger TaxID=82655 RepID=A0A9Q1CYR4_CONCO|nr:hypothetical protein COCON_G00219700 [Conger conger]